MKHLLLISLSLLTLASGFARAEEPTERTIAILILQKAAANSPGAVLADKFRVMASILAKAPLMAATAGHEFKTCTSDTVAFTEPRSSRAIFICEALRTQEPLVIAQTLIHESAHLAGYATECQATTMEAAAMTLSGVGLAVRNEYMDQCGLANIGLGRPKD
jgi:hypothetical protein